MPSGLNATLFTSFVCPVSGLADGLAGGGVPDPHRLVGAAGGDAGAVGAERHAGHISGVSGHGLADGLAGGGVPEPDGLSSLPEAMRVPSGLNATVFTGRHGVGRWVWPVTASQSRTVWSRLPEAIRVPSGLNATLATKNV